MIVEEYKNKSLLKGMDIDGIKKWCHDENIPSFRANQIYQWLYRHGVDSANDMNNLSKDLKISQYP